MGKTGNVIADAMVSSGIEVNCGAFVEWVSKDDCRFPFVIPIGARTYLYERGYTRMYNVIRKTAEFTDTKWIHSKNALITDNALLTWMKSNASLLRIIDIDAVDKFYCDEMMDTVNDDAYYSVMPSDYTRGFCVYIEYNVIRSEFIFHVDMTGVSGEFKEVRKMDRTIDILNWITDHKELVEFIPIVTNMDFEISHRAYRVGKTQVGEVNVSYLGDAITKNRDVMERLHGWIKEGNKINPRNTYYILASKDNGYNLYLRRAKAGELDDR